MPEPESPWVRQPSPIPPRNLLPNTWHVGAGFEVLIVRSVGSRLRGLDVALRLEWTLAAHGLGLEFGNVDVEDFVDLGIDPAEFPGNQSITRHSLEFGLTVSY